MLHITVVMGAVTCNSYDLSRPVSLDLLRANPPFQIDISPFLALDYHTTAQQGQHLYLNVYEKVCEFLKSSGCIGGKSQQNAPTPKNVARIVLQSMGSPLWCENTDDTVRAMIVYQLYQF
jgi:hypothetical protein